MDSDRHEEPLRLGPVRLRPSINGALRLCGLLTFDGGRAYVGGRDLIAEILRGKQAARTETPGGDEKQDCNWLDVEVIFSGS